MYCCRGIKKYQQSVYRNQVWQARTDRMICGLVCESVRIRGTARILKITVNTVLRKIRCIAARIVKAPIRQHQPALEVDELRTYIARKGNEYWVTYALNRRTGEAVDFVVGRPAKGTLQILVNTLLLSGVKVIRTDKLTIYLTLIPLSIHCYNAYGTNHNERKNLSILMHLKAAKQKGDLFQPQFLLAGKLYKDLLLETKCVCGLIMRKIRTKLSGGGRQASIAKKAKDYHPSLMIKGSSWNCRRTSDTELPSTRIC